MKKLGFEDLNDGENYINVDYGTNENMIQQKIIKLNDITLYGVNHIIATKYHEPLLNNIVVSFMNDKDKMLSSYMMNKSEHIEVSIDVFGCACYVIKK